MSTHALPKPDRTRLGTVGIVAALAGGALMILAGLILPQIPVSDGYSLADIHGVCQGPIGQFASGLSADTHDSCNKVKWLYWAGWILAAGGLSFAFSGAMAVRRRRS